MEKHTPVYPYSREEARWYGEMDLWRESFGANCDCKLAIEAAIRRDFDGMHLEPGCAESVIEEFGYKRTEWVLANTLRELSYDGRFSPDNRDWGKRFFIPVDEEHNYQFTVTSHPAVLDGFINDYRRAVMKLGMFDQDQCVPNSGDLNYEGKVLVLSPQVLREECWKQEDQLWYAHDGFGCRPNAIGRSIRCTCLGDGEMTRWNRHDFVGVLKDEYLPDWAQERLQELRGETQEMGGMQMC